MASKKMDFIIDEKGCFVCTSHAPAHFGYRYVQINGIRDYAHRHVYREMFGEIGEKQVVRHKCDNSACINPEHLELGKQSDNINDMVKRGRNKYVGAKGSTNGNSKLNEETVRVIKERLNNSEREIVLALDYDVSIATINSIKLGRTWSHITV